MNEEDLDDLKQILMVLGVVFIDYVFSKFIWEDLAPLLRSICAGDSAPTQPSLVKGDVIHPAPLDRSRPIARTSADLAPSPGASPEAAPDAPPIGPVL